MLGKVKFLNQILIGDMRILAIYMLTAIDEMIPDIPPSFLLNVLRLMQSLPGMLTSNMHISLLRPT